MKHWYLYINLHGINLQENVNHHQHCCENHKSYEVEKHCVPYKGLLLNYTIISHVSQ